MFQINFRAMWCMWSWCARGCEPRRLRLLLPGASGCRFQAPLAVAGPRRVAGSGGGSSQRARNGGVGVGRDHKERKPGREARGHTALRFNPLRGAPADRAPRAARFARPLVVRAPPADRRCGEWSEGAARAGGRRARTRGTDGRFAQASHEPPRAQLRRREPPGPRAPPRDGVRTARASPIAIRAGGGGARTARSAERREDATRHDMAADPRNTTRICRATSTATRRASVRTSRLHAALEPRDAGARARARHPSRSTRRRAVDVSLP